MRALVMAVLKGLAKMAQSDVDYTLRRLTLVLVLEVQTCIHLLIRLETAIHLHQFFSSILGSSVNLSISV